MRHLLGLGVLLLTRFGGGGGDVPEKLARLRSAGSPLVPRTNCLLYQGNLDHGARRLALSIVTVTPTGDLYLHGARKGGTGPPVLRASNPNRTANTIMATARNTGSKPMITRASSTLRAEGGASGAGTACSPAYFGRANNSTIGARRYVTRRAVPDAGGHCAKPCVDAIT